MIHRVSDSWLHWQIGSRVHFGFHARGNCWKFFASPKRTNYRGGSLVWFSWWRFFLAYE